MIENHARPYDNVTEVVGGTPLIQLNSVARDVPGTIYVKCEFMNPCGSLKDRIGLAMVEKAEREGAAQLLTRRNSAVLVRDEGEISGILTRYDLIRDLTGATG